MGTLLADSPTPRPPERPGERQTAEIPTDTHACLPVNCLLLSRGLSAWAFSGHVLPLSVFNFHFPFGGSEIVPR